MEGFMSGTCGALVGRRQNYLALERLPGHLATMSLPANQDVSKITPAEHEAGLDVARAMRVAVFVVAYNAESHIRDTLRRIPDDLRPLLTSIYVIDDSSSDETSAAARELSDEIPELEVFRTPYNQGRA